MASKDRGLHRRRPTLARARAAWDAIVGTVLQTLLWELGFRPRLQPIPVRIRRRR
jgi:hypothetical protein